MNTTAPVAVTAAEAEGAQRLRRALQALAVLAPAAAGLWCLRTQLEGLYELLTGDPTRSVGLLIPPVAALLAWRCWRDEPWQEGQWWGLALITAALASAQAAAGYNPTLVLSSATSVMPLTLIPVGAVICLYVSGVVVLFGGRGAWLKAAFPLLLLLFVNPLPGWFTLLVDLPLQALAARTARGFAALLHVPVSAGTLKMMFSPALGMFIAPGCDGMRGTVTMGLLAAVAGHLYQLQWLRFTLYVMGAVLCAFLLNLVRLCCVVIYYWCALRVPAIGEYGTQIDYAIGGTLFAVAAFLVLGLPRFWAPTAPPAGRDAAGLAQGGLQ
jgi:exosortase J